MAYTKPSQDELLSLWRSLGIDTLAMQSAVDNASKGNHMRSLEMLARTLRDVITLTEYNVKQMRAHKKTWAEVGLALGMTPQAAHKRFRDLS